MGNWLLTVILDKVAGFLDGYKMYIVGSAFVMKGILELIGHYWPDTGFPALDIGGATDHIMYGCALVAGKSAIKKYCYVDSGQNFWLFIDHNKNLKTYQLVEGVSFEEVTNQPDDRFE